MSNLVKHAEEEMRRAGLYDADSDYGGALSGAVMALVKAHAEQQHSGGSHRATLEIFNRLMNFETLTPITSDPEEWEDVSKMSGEPLWQNRRNSAVFSNDGGQTWRNLNEPPTVNSDEKPGASALADLERAVKESGAGYGQITARDKDGKVLMLWVVAEGETAVELNALLADYDTAETEDENDAA